MLTRILGGVWIAVAGLAAVPGPPDWVPVRWPWSDPQTLELAAGTPVNCLLLEHPSPALVRSAAERGMVTLAVLRPGADAVAEAKRSAAGKLTGVVLEGDFPAGTADRVRQAVPGAAVIELASRSHLQLGGKAAVVGTWQGVWPGVQPAKDGAAKAAPTGSPWIDTNSGFIRAVRGWGDAVIWLGNLPPPKTVITGERYLQAIADAALAGARWVIAFDDDFASRLARREAAAMRDWKRITEHLAFLEAHREWRKLEPYGRLAVVQDPESGALLSGGILDMLGARHTPVRTMPRSLLKPDNLKGASMAMAVDPTALTPEQQEVLKAFARGGGTLLTPAPGPPLRPGDRITLDKAELDRLNDIWHDVQAMIGRRNLGARLFNVSSMLSNMVISPNHKEVYLHLVNYSSYAVENVTVHVLGKFAHARLYTPEGAPRDLEVYPTEEGTGVDIDRVSVWATVQLN